MALRSLDVAIHFSDAFFFLRAMKTSIDSLKLAVSWKGAQIPGAKFTVKVCVHWYATLGKKQTLVRTLC